MNIKLFGQRVLIKEQEQEKVGVLYTPSPKDNVKSKRGEVLGFSSEVCDLEVADIVVYNPFGGVPFIVDLQDKYVIIEKKDIYGVLKN